jgi:hypothetical protein
MSDTDDTRAMWRELSRAAYGLAALAAELDDQSGDIRSMDADERERFHGMTGAMASLAESLKVRVVALADEALGIPP